MGTQKPVDLGVVGDEPDDFDDLDDVDEEAYDEPRGLLGELWPRGSLAWSLTGAGLLLSSWIGAGYLVDTLGRLIDQRGTTLGDRGHALLDGGLPLLLAVLAAAASLGAVLAPDHVDDRAWTRALGRATFWIALLFAAVLLVLLLISLASGSASALN